MPTYAGIAIPHTPNTLHVLRDSHSFCHNIFHTTNGHKMARLPAYRAIYHERIQETFLTSAVPLPLEHTSSFPVSLTQCLWTKT